MSSPVHLVISLMPAKSVLSNAKKFHTVLTQIFLNPCRLQ